MPIVYPISISYWQSKYWKNHNRKTNASSQTPNQNASLNNVFKYSISNTMLERINKTNDYKLNRENKKKVTGGRGDDMIYQNQKLNFLFFSNNKQKKNSMSLINPYQSIQFFFLNKKPTLYQSVQWSRYLYYLPINKNKIAT